jgi:succinyl-CoA synthetase alpha subunit
MTNEIIRVVATAGHGLSFALSFGGDRFPVLPPFEAFMAAQNDPQTTHIAYFGELGGEDEYLLTDLLKSGTISKQVICHIAGTAAAVSETPVQFGHAKALAGKKSETARAKRDVLKAAGAVVSETFSDFVRMIEESKTEVRTIVSEEELQMRVARLQKRMERFISYNHRLI